MASYIRVCYKLVHHLPVKLVLNLCNHKLTFQSSFIHVRTYIRCMGVYVCVTSACPFSQSYTTGLHTYVQVQYQASLAVLCLSLHFATFLFTMPEYISYICVYVHVHSDATVKHSTVVLYAVEVWKLC